MVDTKMGTLKRTVEHPARLLPPPHPPASSPPLLSAIGDLGYLSFGRCPNLLSVGPDSCLRSLTTAIMPRGQKSKHRAREKRRQARAETQGLHDQATTSGGEETTSSSPPDSESGPSSSSAAGTSKGPQGAQGTTSAATGAVRKRSGVGHAAPSRSGVGAEGQVREGENSSQASAAAESSHTDLLTWKAEVLVQYMLCKYKMRALIKRSEMLKAVTRRYREQFPEILSRASERMELVFGLVLKEVRPNSHCYTLVSNLDLSDSESMRGDWGLPKNGLLMPLLGVIYLNGNHAPEEKIWNFLNMLGIYDGRSHFIFGEPRKLITEDLVREGYLEYRQVPGSDPPRYEFLWGPKLLTETSKMKVLQFLAKVKDSGHTAFLSQYEDAWREEVESTGDRAELVFLNTQRYLGIKVPQLLSIGPDSCLQSLTTAIMPRGQKSKHRAREKHRQARAETQGLHDQATTSGGEETTSSSPPDSESGPSSSSAAGTSKGPQGAQGTTSAAAGAEGQVREGENSSQASAAAESSHTDLLTWKAEMLVQYMLCKYKMRALIKRSEMLKAVTRRYREQFPEILSRASERMELVFGLVLKEVRPNSHCYTLVSNLDLSDSESMRGDWGLPKNGLLMPLLGVIYLNGNHAPEGKIWKFLNMLGIYDGRSHFIFGEPRKLITEDLVREGYLEYRQVPGSDPPRYEFLWGPKLLTETSKTKVLQFLAKVKDSGHTAFLTQYEEAWREEVESTGDREITHRAAIASGSVSANLPCWWRRARTDVQRIRVAKSGFPGLICRQDLCNLWHWCPNLLSIGPDSCLRSLTTAIMPRGQKSRHRAREKRRQARAETQGLHDQATTSGEEETTSSSPPDSESGPSSSSAAGISKGPQGAQGTTSAAAGAVRKRSGVRHAAPSRSGVGAEGQVQEGENSSQASAAAESSHIDLLTWKAEVLVQYMLCKYKMRALIKRSEMLKAVTRRYREQFPEILSRASERMELVFGLVLKEVRPNSHCYTLVSNLDLSDSESMRGEWGLPKNGLLMPLLGVIYLNGNHAPEEKIWKFLNMLGIHDGRSHFIFGEPRKLITEDLVREGYLEYRQVPGSDPPRYEFLWGPKLLTETSKMKVLQFLAKVKDSGHTAFLSQYEDAWREEVESTGDRDHMLFYLHSCLLSLTTVTMPQGKKGKLHTCDKRRQAEHGTQDLRGAQVTATTMEALSSSSNPGPKVDAKGRSGARSDNHLKCPQGALTTTTPVPASVSPTRSSKRPLGEIGKTHNSSQAPVSNVWSGKHSLTMPTSLLVQFLLRMYKTRKPIRKVNMLKIIDKKYHNRFLRILKRASDSMEVVFGIDVKKDNTAKHSYVLVSKMSLPCNGIVHRGRGFPKTGLLMNLLGVIFMKGNCATEEYIWDFLSKMNIYAGKRHFIFGEPKKLITQDLVQLKYLEYRQVPGSDPACYEFLWGPRAHAETSKMRVLEFLARINHLDPSAFHFWYEEALKDEEERAQANGYPSVPPAVPSTPSEAEANSALCGSRE
ncbi:hypothetical protein JEQ12_019815 [Ovis aries]|uniref:MAGE domain-containing protein n=1 Tax=Ovis aries TaxID=9940 RepID=A0A835ZK12_SHEEP|nr:hypothetical protein JEQ12_019815 [Ovis aries]